MLWSGPVVLIQLPATGPICSRWPLTVNKTTPVSPHGWLWQWSLVKPAAAAAVPLANSIIGMIHPSIMITVRLFFFCVSQNRQEWGKTNDFLLPPPCFHQRFLFFCLLIRLPLLWSLLIVCSSAQGYSLPSSIPNPPPLPLKSTLHLHACL